jgi:hypothetical protein
MSDQTILTANSSADRDPANGQFLLGHTGHGGRPRGSRNKLGAQFVDDLYADWQQHGRDVIVAVRKTDPAAYLRAVSHLLPDQLEVGAPGDFSHLDSVDAVIDAMIAEAGDDLQSLLEFTDEVRHRVLALLGDRARPALPAARTGEEPENGRARHDSSETPHRRHHRHGRG